MNTIREASEDEISELELNFNLGLENVCYVLLAPDGELKGHLMLSFGLGEVFGHDTKCWSDDPHDALRLWKYAKQECLIRGYKEVWLHFNPDEKEEIKEFWKKIGAEFRAEMYSLKIKKEVVPIQDTEKIYVP